MWLICLNSALIFTFSEYRLTFFKNFITFSCCSLSAVPGGLDGSVCHLSVEVGECLGCEKKRKIVKPFFFLFFHICMNLIGHFE